MRMCANIIRPTNPPGTASGIFQDGLRRIVDRGRDEGDTSVATVCLVVEETTSRPMRSPGACCTGMPVSLAGVSSIVVGGCRGRRRRTGCRGTPLVAHHPVGTSRSSRSYDLLVRRAYAFAAFSAFRARSASSGCAAPASSSVCCALHLPGARTFHVDFTRTPQIASRLAIYRLLGPSIISISSRTSCTRVQADRTSDPVRKPRPAAECSLTARLDRPDELADPFDRLGSTVTISTAISSRAAHRQAPLPVAPTSAAGRREG